MALVVKRWYAKTTPNAQGNYVHLVGRQPGFLSWLLSKIGIDPTTEIEAKNKTIVFTSGSLSGREKRVIPMSHVSSAYYGYQKPWKSALLIGVLFLGFFGLGVILGLLWYFLNKRLTVGIVEISGVYSQFSFKRSVIEGQNIDENSAYAVFEIIRQLIDARTA